MCMPLNGSLVQQSSLPFSHTGEHSGRARSKAGEKHISKNMTSHWPVSLDCRWSLLKRNAERAACTQAIHMRGVVARRHRPVVWSMSHSLPCCCRSAPRCRAAACTTLAQTTMHRTGASFLVTEAHFRVDTQ